MKLPSAIKILKSKVMNKTTFSISTYKCIRSHHCEYSRVQNLNGTNQPTGSSADQTIKQVKNNRSRTVKSHSDYFTLLFLLAFLFNSQILAGQTKATNINLGYGSASYSEMTDNEFLTNWQILGPVKINETGTTPDEAAQRTFFDTDILTHVVIQTNKVLQKTKIANTEYGWKSVKSEGNIVDFIKLIGPFNYSSAYALAEIKMESPATFLVGVGSDDGVKIFINGELIHHNWTARALNPDDDILLVKLRKGSNQVLVKVHNIEGEWSFAFRKLGKDLLSNLLFESSGKGNLDQVKLLIENGADFNSASASGLTPYQSAMINGRESVMNFLKEKGAKTDVPLPSLDVFVDGIFKSVQAGTTSGVAVLISKDGKIIYNKGFGFADIGNKVPVTTDTKFRIGSISKQFISSSILKFQEEGKISIQDKLSKFIPDFPRGNEVTIHHLLTHTSGIHSFTDRPNFMKFVTLPVSSKSMVDTIKAYPFDFNPGDRYLYNNSGYFLLGYLIEQISGKSLADFLKENIFEPLGMKNSGIYQTNLLLNNEAYGYSIENGKIIKAQNWDMSQAGGAGAIYSTVNDLYLWNEAVFNEKVLTDESMKAAFTPLVLNNKQTIEYGYGWSLQNLRGLKFISHGGGLNGFLSFLTRQPEQKITISVLCNSTPSPAGINPGSNSMAIAEYLLWKDMEKQASFASDLAIDKSVLKSYTGRYNYGQGAVLVVTLDGKQLKAQMTGQQMFPIYPSSANEFNWKVVEAKVKFVTDENGDVTNLIHYQNGQQIVAKKLPEETPISIDSSIFDKYVGKYNAGNQNIIEITKDGDKLMAQAPNSPRFQLLAATEKEFFVREINIRIIFKVNEQGQTESFSLNTDGVESTATRVAE